MTDDLLDRPKVDLRADDIAASVHFMPKQPRRTALARTRIEPRSALE